MQPKSLTGFDYIAGLGKASRTWYIRTSSACTIFELNTLIHHIRRTLSRLANIENAFTSNSETLKDDGAGSQCRALQLNPGIKEEELRTATGE